MEDARTTPSLPGSPPDCLMLDNRGRGRSPRWSEAKRPGRTLLVCLGVLLAWEVCQGFMDRVFGRA